MVDICSPVIDDHRTKILSTYDKIGKFDQKELAIEVLPSGFRVLDRHAFLTKNEARVLLVGAHTSHGKSALLMQLAAYVSQTEPVIVHSFEMESKEYERRLLPSLKSVEEARASFAERRLYVSNVPNRSQGFVMSSIYEMAQIIGKPGLVVIDYGQQLKPGGQRDQRVVEITDISAGLLQLAQQLKCNVLVGAQLNNEVLRRAGWSQDDENDPSYVPIISDIREGSSLAHDAHTVLMLVRPYVFNRQAPKDKAHFYCLKNRGGELWDQAMGWEGSRCRFTEESCPPF